MHSTGYKLGYKLVIFYFGHVHTREGRGRIRTRDFRFIKRSTQPIKLPIRNYKLVIIKKEKKIIANATNILDSRSRLCRCLQ